MRKNQYLYLGDKTGIRMFYAVGEDKFYPGKSFGGGLQVSIFAFIGITFSAWARKFDGAELNYNGTAYVVCSAIVGILLAAAFCQYTKKVNERYFSNAAPVEVPYREQMVTMLRQAANITRLYSISRVVLIILIILAPTVIRAEKNVILFFTYFVVWFALGYLVLYFNQRERRKVLKMLKKKYLQ